MKSNIINLKPEMDWRWFQWKALDKLHKGARRMALVVSRQHGKTELGIQLLTDFVFRHPKKFPKAVVTMKTAGQAFATYFTRLDQILRKLPDTYYTKQGSKDNLIRVTVKRPWFVDYVTVEFSGIGNIDALRGRTYNLGLFDEAAYYGEKDLMEVLLPTLDEDENALALVTSTVNGMNHFHDLFFEYNRYEKAGDQYYTALVYDVYSAQLRSDEWIRRRKQEHAKNMSVWDQEYLCLWTAATHEEAPFGALVSHTFRDYMDKKLRPPVIFSNEISIVMDVGKPGNNPTWAVAQNPEGGLNFLNYYNEDENNYKLIDRVMAQYPKSRINIVYPEDIEQPDVLDGRTRLQMIQEYVDNKGYNRRVTLKVLPKTRSRSALLMSGLELYNKSNFNVPECEEGLKSLAAVRNMKNKQTGYVENGKFVKNGHQHAADSFCYCAAALNNGYIPATFASENPVQPVRGAWNHAWTYNYLDKNTHLGYNTKRKDIT